MDAVSTLSLAQVVQAVAQARQLLVPKAVVVSTMSAMFAMDQLGDDERRMDSVPLMGGASGLGLGIALGQPHTPVVVLDGDASLMMELGSLCTIAQNRPERFLHLVLHNGVQFNRLVNLPTLSGAPVVDFAAMALAAGYAQAHVVRDADRLSALLPEVLGARGPVLLDVRVQPDAALIGPAQAQPLLPDMQFVRMRLAARRLRAVLQTA